MLEEKHSRRGKNLQEDLYNTGSIQSMQVGKGSPLLLPVMCFDVPARKYKSAARFLI